MVHLYIARCVTLSDPAEKPQLLESLSESRKKKILSFQQKKDRIQSLGGSLLLKKILEQYGSSLERMYYNSWGKPEVEGLYFNLSHSNEFAICAIGAKGNIGCDIENMKKAPLKIAERYFCEGEMDYLKNLPKEKREEGFYRLWTLKESYMKMTGEGMRMGLKAVEFSLNKEVAAYRNGKKCQCVFQEFQIPNYRIAVCSEKEAILDTIEYVEL